MLLLRRLMRPSQIFTAITNWWFARCKFGDEYTSIKNALVRPSPHTL